MLKITNLTKSYGEKKAVDNLSLEIKPGEICGFIGHNGAGKTTTIKNVCGILGFDSGEIEVCGYDVLREPMQVKQNIAYIPDNPDIYEFLTGIKYLNFIADCFGIDTADRAKQIAKYADSFELTGALGNPVSSYSHGMKQKLALISAFMHNPKLLILDEPFVGLDPKAARIVKGLMRDLCLDGGAVFFSTHILDTAEKLCDKVAVIQNGELIAHGTVEEIKGNSSLEEMFFELTTNE